MQTDKFTVVDFYRGERKPIADLLNKYSAQGWRFVAVDATTYFFMK